MQNDPATSKTVERVKLAAQNILDIAGTKKNDGSMQTAVVAIEYSVLTEHPEIALPTISINKALGELALEARWDFEITVAAQNEHSSRHALFMKDPSAEPELTFYDGRPTKIMTELEALAIATDLERTAQSEAINQ